MKIKQLFGVLLAVSIVAAQSISAMEDDSTGFVTDANTDAVVEQPSAVVDDVSAVGDGTNEVVAGTSSALDVSLDTGDVSVDTGDVSLVGQEAEAVSVDSTNASLSKTPTKTVSTKKKLPNNIKNIKAKPSATKKPVRAGAKKQRPSSIKNIKAKPGVAKKQAKKVRGKKVVKSSAKMKKDVTVANIGKFDRKGGMQSFANASDGLIGFMNENASTVTEAQKSELFTVIARFNWITGRKGFDTISHYGQTINLLKAASEHPNLFGSAKMKFITKWLAAKQDELQNPRKIKASAPVKAKLVGKIKKN